MGKENALTIIGEIADADLIRIVLSTGQSRIVSGAILKAYVGSGTAVPFLEVVGTGDDTGLICTEQWSVGKPGDPKESVFGSGDSYGVGLEDTTPEGTPKEGSAWHCTIGNTTDMIIASATDITEILASDSGSTTGLFGGEAVGDYVLVGSDYKYGGTKTKIETLGTVEPLNVLAEYLAAIDTWIPAPFMVTDADAPYTQKGNLLSSCSSCAEQWRFGFNPLNLPVSWDKVTLTINGTPYTKYWARFRITATITLDPIIQQLKMHTNRFEVNSDGVVEYFGIARYPKSVEIEKHENADITATNQDISIAVGMTETRIENKFNDNSESGIILSGVVPEGTDTSIPVIIAVDWYPIGTGVGNVELKLKTVAATEDFEYDGTTIPNVQAPVVTAINNQPNQLQRSLFLVSAFTALPGDKIYGSLERDARVANVNDTFPNGIVITGYQVTVYSWRS